MDPQILIACCTFAVQLSDQLDSGKEASSTCGHEVHLYVHMLEDSTAQLKCMVTQLHWGKLLCQGRRQGVLMVLEYPISYPKLYINST